jgi:hypothetical protein
MSPAEGLLRRWPAVEPTGSEMTAEAEIEADERTQGDARGRRAPR